MSCSSAASLYIQCVDRARQVNYTRRDMSLIQNTDWEKGFAVQLRDFELLWIIHRRFMFFQDKKLSTGG